MLSEVIALASKASKRVADQKSAIAAKEASLEAERQRMYLATVEEFGELRGHASKYGSFRLDVDPDGVTGRLWAGSYRVAEFRVQVITWTYGCDDAIYSQKARSTAFFFSPDASDWDVTYAVSVYADGERELQGFFARCAGYIAARM